MKKLFQILSIFMCFFIPTFAMADCSNDPSTCCPDYNTPNLCANDGYCKWDNNNCVAKCQLNQNQDGCVSYDGCSYTSVTMCTTCDATKYNFNVTSGTQSTACLTCSVSSGQPYFNYTTGQIFDQSSATVGQTTCPWICAAGYYKNGNSCDECPGLTTQGHITSHQGSTDIADCYCELNYYKYYANNNDWISALGCGTASDAWYLTPVGGGSAQGLKCGRYAKLTLAGTNTTCTCPQNSSFNNQNHECVCNSGYTRYENNGEYICSRCSVRNSSPNPSDLTTCRCNAGYYGNASGTNGSCDQCPPGYTSDPGNNTQRSNCYMDSNTEFCDANGNCMKLLHDLSGRIIAPNP